MPDGPELFEAAAEALGLKLVSAEPTAGGDINQAWKLGFGDGSSAFLKSRAGAPPEEFEMEAAGLEWLGSAGGLRVPEVLAVVREPQPGLLLEWIQPGRGLDDSGEEAFGRGLARIHQITVGAFGALPPGSPHWGLHVGPVPLEAEPVADEGQGFGEFYAKRIEALAGQAQDRGAIGLEEMSVFETLAENIDELAGEPEKPALTHGDLWSGNLLVSSEGEPCLIDPVAHGAHRELDLAMLMLFGSQSRRFIDSYEDAFPLSDGWQERVRLWQIQPLLIHAVLFGGSYGSSAAAAAQSFI